MRTRARGHVPAGGEPDFSQAPAHADDVVAAARGGATAVEADAAFADPGVSVPQTRAPRGEGCGCCDASVSSTRAASTTTAPTAATRPSAAPSSWAPPASCGS
ncbi:hypothetical protein ACFQV8_18685 [Pseudonocardia benzenivorans]